MKDKLSALLDGQLEDEAVTPVLESIRKDRALRLDWAAYCMIGDVLRGDTPKAADVVGRVMAQLDSEPTLLAPKPSQAQPRQSGLARSLMPLAASLMGVAAVGWVAHTLYAQPDEAPRFAAVALQVAERVQESAAVAESGPADPHREYVFVHQTMTAGGPFSGAIQHVRTVSDMRQDMAR